MRIARRATVVVTVALSLAGAAARAGNVVYEFNQSPDGWTVTSDGLNQPQRPWEWDDGVNGWSAYWGDESAGSGTYLVSPLLCVDPDGSSDNAQFVRLEMLHLFNFGTGTNPATLGQAQYRVNFGPWLGIRSDDFDPTNNNPPEHYRPLYADPPDPFIDSTPYPLTAPPVDWPVAAWDGATANFAQGQHKASNFTLNYFSGNPLYYPIVPGDFIEFRFLMGTLVSSASSTPEMNWEITKVEIKGVVECVPEPGGIGLALVGGGLAAAGFCCRRRGRPRDWLRVRLAAITRSAAAGVLVAVAVFAWMVLSAAPAKADPIVATFNYDFATGPNGWTAQNANYAGIAFSPNTWLWSGGLWQVDPVAVISRFNWVANYLTSPVITVPAGADRFDITIRHRFRFPTDITTLEPITAGQFVWRQFDPANPNAPFQPFANGDEWRTGTVPPPFNTLSPYPSYVAPTYPVPASYPPLISGDEAFRDASPGWSNDFVISGVSLDGNLAPGQQIQLRFINANLGVECTGGGWDVSRVSINAVAPEPGGILLAAVGGGVAVGGTWLRRRYQRPSRPSERPVRNTLPPVSVA